MADDDRTDNANANKMDRDESEAEEEMETDAVSDTKDSEDVHLQVEDVEEGELSDVVTNNQEPGKRSFMETDTERRYENKEGGFITGVDICGEEEQSKLGERAKRFGLDPSTIKPLTEQELKKLYESLGVSNEEGVEKTFRLQALHMRGTEDMSTQDVFTYFKAYGPASVEWINDYTCNVVWLENVSAARALIGLSRQIRGLEKLSTRVDSDGENKEGKDEVIVTEEDSESDDAEMADENNKQHDKEILSTGPKPTNTEPVATSVDEAVDAQSITTPIPPGKWRVGVTHPKAKNILLRFAMRSDKKHPKAEKLSEYYKKYGNPNYGGIPGILTESRKRRFRQGGPHNKPNKEDNTNFDDENDFDNSKNPWGTLAKTWSSGGNQEHYERYSPPRRKTPPLRSSQDSGRRNAQHFVTGARSTSTSQSDSSGDEEMSARTKIPRMRMYADEEEVKIEKRKAKKKKQTLEDEELRSMHQPDLRHRLGREHHSSSNERHRDRGRERDRDHEHRERERVSSRVSSTVWSRLHHGTKREPVRSKHDSVEKRRETRPTPEKENSDDSDELFDKQGQLAFVDLRSKLNSMKTVRQKSPLRIEIDNDEYYRVIGSESDE